MPEINLVKRGAGLLDCADEANDGLLSNEIQVSGGAPEQSEFEHAEISAFKTLKNRSQAITQRSTSMGSGDGA